MGTAAIIGLIALGVVAIMLAVSVVAKVEHEYEYRDAEYECEEKHEQMGAPKSPTVRF